MKLTRKFKIPYEKNLYDKLEVKSMEAGKVWSDIVQYGKDYYDIFKHWIQRYCLEIVTRKTYELHSGTVQAIVAKYTENRMATLTRRKNGDIKVRYPYKRKKHYAIPYKKAGMVIDQKKIILKHYRYEVDLKSILIRGNQKIKKFNDYIEIINLAHEDISNISYAEIVYKNGYYWFYYVVKVSRCKQRKKLKPAGCDLGEIHSMVIASEDRALLISGRALRAIKQYRAKMLAEFSKKMSRCRKGSIKWENYNSLRQRLKVKSNQQIDYLIHKSTKMVVNFLIKEKVSDLVVGNPAGIEKGTKSNPKKRRNRTRRQQLSIWSYGEFKKKIKYKCKLNGIKVHFVSEHYTSQDCPFCKGRHRATGRNFICPVHNVGIHRDVNGAQNICRKKFKIPVKPIKVLYKQPVWYKNKVSPNRKA